MEYLLIDMSEKSDIHLVLFDEEKKVEKNFEGQNRELLLCIDNFFIENNVVKENIKGIMVVVGVGTFTSTRIACVVANTFAFVLQIPLLAIGIDDIVKIQDLIPSLLTTKRSIYFSYL